MYQNRKAWSFLVYSIHVVSNIVTTLCYVVNVVTRLFLLCYQIWFHSCISLDIADITWPCQVKSICLLLLGQHKVLYRDLELWYTTVTLPLFILIHSFLRICINSKQLKPWHDILIASQLSSSGFAKVLQRLYLKETAHYLLWRISGQYFCSDAI